MIRHRIMVDGGSRRANWRSQSYTDIAVTSVQPRDHRIMNGIIGATSPSWRSWTWWWSSSLYVSRVVSLWLPSSGWNSVVFVIGVDWAVIHCVVDVAAQRRFTASILLLQSHQRVSEKQHQLRRSDTHLCRYCAIIAYYRDTDLF